MPLRQLPDNLRSLNDPAWFKLLVASVTQPVIGGIEFPRFPPTELQEAFVGASGEVTLRQAYSFYIFVKTQMQSLGHPLGRESRFLDFGCGWGRFLRFFWKDVDAGNLFGCDTNPAIIDLCTSLGMPGQLSVIHPLGPLPYPDGFFDGVLAYSVFTHLPETVHLHWARELARVCAPGGVVCLTLESRRFIDMIADVPPDTPYPRLAGLRRFQPELARHTAEYANRGFTYFPSCSGLEDVYGDAACTAGFMAETWGRDFDLKTYIDHAAQMSQAAVALQRRRPDDFPVSERIDTEIEDIRRSGLFDPEYYRAMYPDIQPPPKDSLHHYCARGWREGRNPADDLDMVAYRAAYRDVAEADINPLWHYVIRGRAEGRLASPEIESRYEDDTSGNRLPDDVRLVACYAAPDWPAVRQAHVAVHGPDPQLMPHRDLGTYDPTDPRTLAAQAALCRRHGIAAWCFRLDAACAVESASPLVSFLNQRGVQIDFMLDIDLRGPAVHDSIRGLAARAIADDRCLQIAGRPAVMFSLPTNDDACRAALADVASLAGSARTPYRICRRDGLLARTPDVEMLQHFDAVIDFPLSLGPCETGGVVPSEENGCATLPYGVIVSQAIARMERSCDPVIPCHRAVIPGRHDSPLRERQPLCFTRPTLKAYRRWLDAAIADARATQPRGARLVFLDAWNDWNRGAVLEPDQRTGYARLNETTRALLGIPAGTTLPKVSVVVMPSDDTTFLRQRLESVYGQTYGNVEVLLLDDSARAACDIFAEYAERFPEITRRLLMSSSPGERFRQWAEGIRAATGDLVWIAGGDGFCDDDLLNTLVRCFDDEAVLLACARTDVAGRHDPRDRTKSALAGDGVRHSRVTTAHREVAGGLEAVMGIQDAGAVVFRRPINMPLLADENWLSSRITGDWVFFLHVMRGGRIAYSSQTCAYIRQSTADAWRGFAQEAIVRELTAVGRAVACLYDTPLSTLEAFQKHAMALPALDGCQRSAAIASPGFVESLLEARRERSPNIAVAAMGFYPGGAEIQPIRIANELKRQGHSVVFLSAGFDTRESRVRGLLRSDVPVIETQDIHLTKQLLHDFGIEVLNSHAWIVQNYPSLVPDVFAGLSAHVATLHGMIEHGNENTVSPASLRRADECVSTWVYTAEKNLGPFIETGLYDAASPRFTKLPNGMEPPAADPIRRSDLGIPDDAFVLCCVSRAIPEKGWPETIEAVTRARTMTGRDIRLILVGKGQLYDEYLRSGVPPFVSLIGFHENSVRFYAAADMGILLTRFKSESFPLTIIECLFAGRPFIATDVGEIRDMLDGGQGLAGDLISLDDWNVPVDRAAEAIARHAERPELVLAASERALKAAAKFRIDHVAAAYTELFSRDIEAGARIRSTQPLTVRSAESWVPRVESQCGATIDELADRYCSQRPEWVAGDVSRVDARFLMREALNAQTSHFVEIGTASGMSTGLLCLALDKARQTGLVGDEFRVVSYDLLTRFYGDANRRVGDAARSIVDPELLSHIMFRNPATALDAVREHKPDSVRFLFIDASHDHPWPALDLLATLPILTAGATVVLHDVNLPLVLPQFPDWGAHHLFHGLSLEKRLAAEGYQPGLPPNVGSVVIPADKRALREEILGIIAAHPWETDVPDSVLAALGVRRP